MIDEVKEVELYDLDVDIAETTNVAKQHPDIVARLLKQVSAARMELGDAGTIGSGARSFDKGVRRPDTAAYKRERVGRIE